MVKTLHPKIHGGILARREVPEHMAAIAQAGIEPIDLVVVNLYPFQATIADPDCRLEDAVENIDIGGPAMLRSAAKNHAGVAVVVDPADYGACSRNCAPPAISAATRFELAKKVFAHTAAYDGAIASYLSSLDADGRRHEYPGVLNLQFAKLQDLRYGENPHQSAALYRDLHPAPGSLVTARQLQGKELAAPSAQAEIVHIKWMVKATLDRKMAGDIEDKVDLPIFTGASGTSAQLVEAGVSNEPGEADLMFLLPGKEWVMGETIAGQLQISPKKELDVTEIRVELVRRERVPRDLGNEHETSMPVKLSDGIRLMPGQDLTLPFSITIPSPVPATFSTPNSTLDWLLKGVLARRLRKDTFVEDGHVRSLSRHRREARASGDHCGK